MAKLRKAPKGEKPVYQGNAYDKIFKENAEAIFIPFIEEHIGTKIKRFKHLKEKMQVTIEREMDFFYEVETEKGEIFILHLEFQTEDDMEMVYRKGEIGHYAETRSVIGPAACFVDFTKSSFWGGAEGHTPFFGLVKRPTSRLNH